jgi:aquaporin PIP
MIFLSVTVGVVISTNLDNASSSSLIAGAMTPARHLIIALTFGLTITTLVYIFAPVSGANINPAVTLALVVSKALDPLTGIFYVIAQCLGAAAGCGLVKAIQSDHYDTYGGGANGVNNPSFGAGNAFLAEVCATFLLCFTVLAAVDGGPVGKNAALHGTHTGDVRPANGAVLAFPIGFAVLLAHLWLIPIDGTSINPARSFGAALVANEWDDHWVFWAGPLLGSLLSACVYQFVFNEHWLLFLESGTVVEESSAPSETEQSNGNGTSPLASSAEVEMTMSESENVSSTAARDEE